MPAQAPIPDIPATLTERSMQILMTRDVGHGGDGKAMETDRDACRADPAVPERSERRGAPSVLPVAVAS